MPITRVDKGQIDVATNSVAFIAPLTALVQPGDVIVYTITTTSSTSTSTTPVPTATGTLFASGVGTSDAVQSAGWYYVVPSTVPADIRVQFGATRQGTLAWVAYRGVDNTTPMDVAPVPGSQSAASSSTPSIPSITTVTAGAMIVAGINHGSGSTTISSLPSPWQNVVDGTRRNGIILEKGIQAAAGASGATAITLSAAQQSRMWAAALRPVAGDPPLVATLTSQAYPSFTGDVADGAAIVPDPVTPANSVVITTNKEVGGGLYVLGLDGLIKSSNLDGAANSVDWRDLTGVTGWDNRLLVMTSDREDGLLRFYWMNRTTKALTAAGTSAALGWEPYGTCLYVHSDGQVYAFVTQRGTDDASARNLYQYPLSRSSETVTMGAAVRTVSVSSVAEGLAADDANGYLYLSQEDVGLYRYSASPSGGSTRTTIEAVGTNLVADVEDVAVSRLGGAPKLLVSSQGDSSFHVYDLTTLAHEARFTIVRPGGTDPVTSSDGVDMALVNLGPTFPNGLIVVHDGDKTPVSDFAFLDAELVFGELPSTPVVHQLSGTVDASSAAVGAITARHQLSGAIASTAAASGSITARHQLSGTVQGVSATSGSITARHQLSGTVASVSATTASITARHQLSGTASSTSAVSGSVTARHQLSGTAAGTVDVSGSITVRKQLSGTAQAISGSSGTIIATHRMSGTIAALAGAQGAFTARRVVSGQVNSVSTALGSILARHQLAGQVDAVSGTFGDISGAKTLSGTVQSLSSVSGAITARHQLSALLAALSGVEGEITALHTIAGQVDAQTQLYGNPIVVGAPEPDVHQLSGTVVAFTGTQGSIVARHTLGGTVVILSSTSGTIASLLSLSGTIEVVSGVYGNLIIPVPPDDVDLVILRGPYTRGKIGAAYTRGKVNEPYTRAKVSAPYTTDRGFSQPRSNFPNFSSPRR